MDISDIELQFLKDVWADSSRREITKRAIAIALGNLGKGITVETVLALGAELDRMLLPEEEEDRNRDANLTH